MAQRIIAPSICAGFFVKAIVSRQSSSSEIFERMAYQDSEEKIKNQLNKKILKIERLIFPSALHVFLFASLLSVEARSTK